MRAGALTAFLFLAACSRSAVDGTIGPAGGVREAEGGARLDVPMNALKAEEAISMARTGTFPAAPAGTQFNNGVYELQPHGLRFDIPAVLRVPANAGDVLLTADPGTSAWTVVEGAAFEEGSLVASVRHFSFFAAAKGPAATGATIYFSDGAALRSIDADGGTLATLVPGSRPSRGLTGVAIDATRRQVYWSDGPTTKVSRIGYDVSGQSALVTAVGAPRGVAVDSTNGRVFWAEGITVRSSLLDGGSPTTVVTGTAPSSVAVEPGAQRVYWTDEGTDAIRRADYFGAGGTLLYQSGNPFANPRGLAIDLPNGRLFWAEGSDVKTASLDGTLVTTAVAGNASAAPSAIAVDPKAKRIYWTDTGTDAVHMAPYSGSPTRKLFEGGDDPAGIAVDPGP